MLESNVSAVISIKARSKFDAMFTLETLLERIEYDDYDGYNEQDPNNGYIEINFTVKDGEPC